MMLHLLPTTADAAAPTVTWLRPDEGADVSVADPVEIEVEAVDERGDVKEVRLSVDDQLVQRKVSFPFQMRWQPTAADVGADPDAERRRSRTRRATSPRRRGRHGGARDGIDEAPLPTGVTTFTGTPVVGERSPASRPGSPAAAYAVVPVAARRGGDRRRDPATYCRSRPTSERRWPAASRRPTRRQRGLDVRGAHRLRRSGGAAGPPGPPGPPGRGRSGRPGRRAGPERPARGPLARAAAPPTSRSRAA